MTSNILHHKNTFYGILSSTYTCIACHTVSTTSFNFCELEVQVMRNIETGIQKSKSFNLLKFCETCNCKHVVEIDINYYHNNKS